MSQKFKVTTYLWTIGVKTKDQFFDTLEEATAFAEEQSPHFHIIKVFNETGKNVLTKKTIRTVAEDPDGAHSAQILEAKAAKPTKGETPEELGLA
jgi:hypothetical protein